MSLRPYQEKIVDKMLWSMSLPGNDLVVVSQGGGKTHIISEFTARLGAPILILVPNKELLEQDLTKLSAVVDKAEIGVYSASMNSKTVRKYTLATIQSAYKHPDQFAHYKVVIVDECFVAGTKVGRKNIENIIPGDYVDSYNHKLGIVEKKKVISVSKKELSSKLYLTDLTHNSIISTGNHPILVKNKGYIPVEKLKKGDIVYAEQKQSDKTTPLYRVWENGRYQKLSPILEIQTNWKPISQDLLIHSPWRFDFQDKEIPAHTLLRVLSDGNVYKIEVYWSQTQKTGGEWKTILSGSNEIISMAWRWLEERASGRNRYAPASLQDRYSPSNQKNRNRSRWWGSWVTKSKRGRQTKTGFLAEQRVESVAIYEPRNYQKNGENSHSPTYVYNLEVEDNHNYFANGTLVHNCDLINPKNLEGMYRSFFTAIGNPKIYGLTGTPFRQDVRYERWGYESWQVKSITITKMINRYQQLFWNRMLATVSTKYLTDQGFLSPIEYHDEPLLKHEQIPVNKSKSDFDMDRFDAMIADRYAFIADKIKAIPHKSKLIFCASITQANALQKFIEGSVVVTSETTRKEREKAVSGLRSGQITCLLNVGIYTVGFDYPELDCIVLLRPTRSLRLHCQILGRVARRAEGKVCGHVYDFVSNVSNLGKLDDIRVEKVDNKWNVVSSSYPQGFHNVGLYEYKLKRRKNE